MTTYKIPNQPEYIAFHERSSLNGIDVPLQGYMPQNGTSQLKELPLEIVGRGRVKGFLFRQIAKSDRGYIYEVTQPGLPVHFEVFKRIKNQRFNCISYPAGNSIGVWGWTAKDLVSALQRFENF